MLWHIVNRARQAKLLNEVIVATSEGASDDPIASFCEQENVLYYRGSEDDVLDRYYQAAKRSEADVIVRVTGDCPLVDPALIDDLVNFFLEGGDYDYASNIAPPTFPDGLDVEVFSFTALERAWIESKLISEREHVTPYIRNNPKVFRIGNVINDEDLSAMRWTVDEPADLEFVRGVFEKLDFKMDSMMDVLSVLERYPELTDINSGIARNLGYHQSLKVDQLINKISSN